MSIEKPTAQELHMADQIGMMLEEVEKYASPGLAPLIHGPV
ncbi:hypothetical protein ACK8HH_03655 [Gordonia sp. LUNF6]